MEHARTWPRSPLGHRVENMTTRALERAAGTLPDGTAGSVIVKTLQPASASPAFAQIPPGFHEQVLQELHWLDEPRVYRSGLADAMPDGLRLPVLHAVDESADEITLWLEDVADVTPWDTERYRRSAAALGRLGARWPGDTAMTQLGMTHRPIAGMFFGKIVNHDLAIQADDAFWDDPMVASAVDRRHRADLYRLAELMPALLAQLDELPRGMCHGDATPDNLREPGDGTIVAIDWSYGHVGELGSDLGQLLVGRYEAGTEALDVEVVATAIRRGFLDGVGDASDASAVERAWATHLAVRSVFSAVNVDHRPDLDDEARAALLARRAKVARFGLDLALRHATSQPSSCSSS